MQEPVARALPNTRIFITCPLGCGSTDRISGPQVLEFDLERDRAILAMATSRLVCAVLGATAKVHQTKAPHASRREHDRRLFDAPRGIIEADANPQSAFRRGLAELQNGCPPPRVPRMGPIATLTREWPGDTRNDDLVVLSPASRPLVGMSPIATCAGSVRPLIARIRATLEPALGDTA